MTKRRSTKHALMTSVLSLFLCFAMLLGTTFAWFTDSVTSANNIITSGNLDVELYFQREGETTWTPFDANTNVFKQNARWEPGHTEVVKLKVVNEGSLALKYQLGVNIASETPGTNVKGEAFRLSDYIMYGIVDGAPSLNDRDSAIKAVSTVASELKNAYTSNGNILAKTATETKYPEAVFTMVVYMPTEVGNEANYKKDTVPPQIKLGINLFATQYTYESDSFDENYDKDAWHPDMKVYTAADLQAALNNGVKNIQLENDITLTESIVVPAAKTVSVAYGLRNSNAVVIDLNDKTISSAEGMDAPVIYNKGVLNLKNGTINAVQTTAIRNHGASAELTLDNLNVSQTVATNPEWQGAAVFTSGGANTVINSGTYSGVSSAAIVATSGGYLEINGGTFTANVTTIRVDTWSENSFLTISDGTFNVSVDGAKALYADGYKAADGVNINGGTFNGTLDSTYTAININGGTFTKSIKQSGGHQNYYNISGGTFIEDVSGISKNTVVVEDYKAVKTEKGWVVISNDLNYVAEGVLASSDKTIYYISGRDGYSWMDEQADNFFGNKTLMLTDDIDFGGDIITPIKFWSSHPTFDGQGHTLSNFVIEHSGSKTGSGLFSGTFDVKNLVIYGAKVTGDYAGAISGWMYGNIDNCTVKNSIITSTYWQCGGLAGQYNSGNVTNSAVENCEISGGAAVGGLIGILNETKGERRVESSAVKNCKINITRGFGGDYNLMFGAAIGLININDSTVYLNCENEGNTVKDEAASDTLCGLSESGTTVYVNGAQVVNSAAELKSAIENASNGDTVRVMLASDIEATSATTAAAGINVVIYGNGKIVTTIGMNDKYFLKSNGGAVEINDLTIKGDAKYALYSTGGRAVLTNTTINMDGNYKVCFYGGGVTELNDCTINGNASFVSIWFGDGRTATINGGRYSSMCINASKGAGVVSAGSLVVNDATVDIIYGGALEVDGEVVRASITNNNSTIGKIEYEL